MERTPAPPCFAVACALAACVAAGCTSSPEPPAPPEGFAELTERYERPTAKVPLALVPAILARVPELDLVQATGLPVLRRVLGDVNDALHEHDEVSDDVDLRGSLDARRPCPGLSAAQDPSDRGWMTVTVGVEASRLQRWLRGQAQGCRYTSDDGVTQVVSTMSFEADLGQEVTLGQPLPAYLLARLSDVSATVIEGEESTIFARGEFDFRVTEGGAVEVLVDLATLDVGAEGTAVPTLYPDGTRGLRTSDAEWRCGKTGRSCGQRR